MSDRQATEQAAQQAATAKQRFFVMSILRLSGVFIVMFGLGISLGRLGGLHGRNAQWLGFVISVIGLLQFGIVPRWLARIWSSAHQKK